MQVHRLPAHLVPGSEGVVAEHEHLPADPYFRIMLHAHPARRLDDRIRIIVADDKVFSTVQSPEQHVRLTLPGPHEVTQVPEFIIRENRCVPQVDQSLVVFGPAGKRPTIDRQDPRVGEMRVAREIDHAAANAPVTPSILQVGLT